MPPTPSEIPTPPSPSVICCGLSTVDLQLHQCNLPIHLEHITSFSHTTSTPGGSSPQTAISLASLGVSVSALTAVGDDDQARTLRSLLGAAGVDISGLLVDGGSPTALAILPLFVDGRRGCFVTLGANLTLKPSSVLQSPLLIEPVANNNIKVFHFGYPHLMPHFQGESLANFLNDVRTCLPNAMITLDVNGAGDDSPVLIPNALKVLAHLHANVEEACAITGLFSPETAADKKLTSMDVRKLTDWFISRGVASVSITCGRDGAFLATTPHDDVFMNACIDANGLQTNAFLFGQAFRAQTDDVNASGAGDAFSAGIVAQLVQSKGQCGAQHLLESGLASALRRIDHTLVSEPTQIDQVVTKALERKRIAPHAEFS